MEQIATDAPVAVFSAIPMPLNFRNMMREEESNRQVNYMVYGYSKGGKNQEARMPRQGFERAS
jgi:hypothetical protein